MDDRYISDKKLKRLYSEIREKIGGQQLLDLMASDLKKEPAENPAANAPCYTAPQWPICQNCGKPMVYCGKERIGDMIWEQFGCTDCYNQNVCRKVPKGEKTNGCSEK